MLTKQEREEIAERANECVAVCGSLYEVLLGHRLACNTTYEEAMKKLLARIVDLCDTSNMIELPLDKDGEVIRIGDTVYDDDNLKYEVVGYMSTDQNIILKVDGKTTNILAYAETLTHKQPVTVKTLVERIKNVMNDDSTTVWAYDELDDIAEQLERLGDSDEA